MYDLNVSFSGGASGSNSEKVWVANTTYAAAEPRELQTTTRIPEGSLTTQIKDYYGGLNLLSILLLRPFNNPIGLKVLRLLAQVVDFTYFL